MNKKLMLLALGAVSAMMLAVPAMASAILPLHVTPQPVGAKVVDDGAGNATLTTHNGLTVTCASVTGTVTFTSTTGGEMQLTFGNACTSGGFTCTSHKEGPPSVKEPAGSIKTYVLPFELGTVAHPAGGNGPGVLVTPSGVEGKFADFTCAGGLVPVVVTGNGVLGTITTPSCGGVSAQPVLSFTAAAAGTQTHTKLTSTATEYSLKKGAELAAQEGVGSVTLGVNTTLVCT